MMTDMGYIFNVWLARGYQFTLLVHNTTVEFGSMLALVRCELIVDLDAIEALVVGDFTNWFQMVICQRLAVKVNWTRRWLLDVFASDFVEHWEVVVLVLSTGPRFMLCKLLLGYTSAKRSYVFLGPLGYMLRAWYLWLICIRSHVVEHMSVDFLATTSMSIGAKSALLVNHRQRTRFAVFGWVGPIFIAHAELLSFDICVWSVMDGLAARHFVLYGWSGSTFGAFRPFVFHLLELTTILSSKFVEVAIGAADLISMGWVSWWHGSLLLHLSISFGVSVEDVFCGDAHILGVSDLVKHVGVTWPSIVTYAQQLLHQLLLSNLFAVD